MLGVGILHYQQVFVSELECFDGREVTGKGGYASVNSTCAQLPPGYCGAFARLVSPGSEAFANFALPGGWAFANPRAILELLTRTQFPIRI